MRIRAIFILLFALTFARGQDGALPDLTNYQHNWLIFNPAFSGSRDVMSFSFFSKDDAILDPGFPAPKFIQFSLHSPFANSQSNAFGFSYYNEKLPGFGPLGINFSEPIPLSRHNLSGYYSHRVRLKSGGRLSFGLSGILGLKKTDNSSIDVRQPGDPWFASDFEPVLTGNFSFGVLYYTFDNEFFTGLSVPRLLPGGVLVDKNNYDPDVAEDPVVPLDTLDTGTFISNYNFLYTVGKKFKTDHLTIYPNCLLSYVPAIGFRNLDYMVSLNFGLIEEKFWVGTTYKSANDLAVNINFEIFDGKGLLGLSWDFSLSSTPGYFDNAFEIIFRYDNLTKVISKAPFYF